VSRIKYICGGCGDLYTLSKLKKGFSQQWEKNKGYNRLECPKCEHKGSFDIYIYFSKNERKQL